MEEGKTNSNLLWKLDLLETKFNGFNPRLPLTKRLLSSKNNKVLRHLPSSEEEAKRTILELKTIVFQKKYHGAYKKLHKEVKRFWKLNKKRLTSDRKIEEFFANEDNIACLVTSKLIKILSTEILTNKELRSDPPQYLTQEIREVIKDPINHANPSTFFIRHCKDNKEFNTVISNLWNKKSTKSVLDDVKWSFQIVKGNICERMSGKRASELKEKNEKDSTEDPFENFINSKRSKYDKDETIREKGITIEPHLGGGISRDRNIKSNINTIAPLLKPVNESRTVTTDYEDNQSPDSSDQSEPSKTTDLSDNDDDEFLEENNHPDFPLGYISGSEEESGEDDEVVKEATTQRKNRRGQRARQKIWAKKFGKEAAHIKKARTKKQEERNKKQQEYEERNKRRKLKAQNENGIANTLEKSNNPDRIEKVSEEKEKAMHPSWHAKKLAEQKLKDTNFQGKKIIFD